MYGRQPDRSFGNVASDAPRERNIGMPKQKPNWNMVTADASASSPGKALDAASSASSCTTIARKNVTTWTAASSAALERFAFAPMF